MIQQNGAGVVFVCWHFCWHSRVEEIQILATLAVGFGGEGRNRTRKLYRSEPNTLCFKAYSSLILQGFKPFFTARPTPAHCPVIAPLLLVRCNFG
jgi:hypothetical protein